MIVIVTSGTTALIASTKGIVRAQSAPSETKGYDLLNSIGKRRFCFAASTSSPRLLREELIGNTRRHFIQQSVLVASTCAFVTGVGAAQENAAPKNNTAKKNTMAAQETTDQQIPEGTKNVFGGNHFDPAKWLIVPAKTFADLKVGDVFRCPSRTLTDAHTSAFQAVSADTHPRHYNAPYAQAHGMPTMLIQPFQLLAMTVPGASLFTHYVGESIAGLKGVSCDFGQDSYVGDTMYPALEIQELRKEGGKGHVLMAIVIYNQKGQLVLFGHQKFELKLL